MSNWREEYFLALGVRDAREQANAAVYDAYTRLADRTSSLHTDTPAPGVPPSASHTTGSPAANRKPTPPSKTQLGTNTPLHYDQLPAAVRQDLAEAQRSRTELLDKLSRATTELEKLKKKTRADTRRIEMLVGERAQLMTRVKDRDEELRGKAKLLDNLQSELVSLNLQFNMAEERSKKLETENKELVDRWMARMGQEAEAMNKASKYS
ncbi:autophagy protein [Paracoccidioides lutzii Pb01]|uniref:Autophagy protein n=1 Tax=Paracoccidioides lutzii (strain ATCC MYA-826 / Pb01) TaxID=502779 RepID=C1GUY6_PARBA|nr:autophagy protein [Paracoccidioides lutzii Pb01]EEH40404.2 autophagy protein [Paracoccidioides lutzii Pb01]